MENVHSKSYHQVREENKNGNDKIRRDLQRMLRGGIISLFSLGSTAQRILLEIFSHVAGGNSEAPS